MHQGIKTYANLGNYTAATDADPHTLITMLFDGALERIASAKGAMQAGDVAMKGLMISKAITVVDGLRAHLDLEKGGEIAENLRNLYDFAENRLFEANFNNSAEMLDEVTQILLTLKEAWVGIKPKAEKPATEESSYE
ncbi:MAG TPA: flagellar export chaperone FliS [Gammaproteobacteria bacterium]|nr:flagellar export chaperone FliS [Gammaproteobacteria bacterium]MEC8009157.1 flagellar export chaperone FliS [Pseudomonadota bacterium]HCK94499.1 flagellar export chaperone FliS [Gammaproteobacteria bacterium]|tara:strand:+ start:3247 stop:3660 length:414 start_codon:yes stop_codon:yes gene_type:complete